MPPPAPSPHPHPRPVTVKMLMPGPETLYLARQRRLWLMKVMEFKIGILPWIVGVARRYCRGPYKWEEGCGRLRCEGWEQQERWKREQDSILCCSWI